MDLFAKNHPEKTENLDAIGVYSPFHESYGYYADPVDEKTATLPQGWRGRLVNLPPGDTEGVLDYVWIRMILRSQSTARREKKIFSSTVSSLGGGSWIARNCCSYYSSPLLMSKPGRELRKPTRWISAVRKPNNPSTQGSAFDQRQSRERGREDARRPLPRGRGKACDRYGARAAVGPGDLPVE